MKQRICVWIENMHWKWKFENIKGLNYYSVININKTEFLPDKGLASTNDPTAACGERSVKLT